MLREKRWVIINLVSFLFLLGASAIFVNGGNMLNSSNVMPIFMPAPYAFSIWSFIYLLLGIWVLKGLRTSEAEDRMYEEVGYWFALAMIFTGLTILVPINLSAIMIVLALITSLIVYKKVSESDVSRVYRVPFSLLIGWLSVATIVNISLVLKMQGITELLGIGEVGWAIIMLAIGTIIAVILSITQDDIIYPLVFIWGYIAIAINNSELTPVVRMASIMIGILVIVMIYTIVSRLGNDEE